ncbi:IS3 family transposase [Mammaliicoccus sciuri]|uniref:IS3 family transposase n=1 Tax=Mammaliicoccus sciuri TaxID=1296 RepID=UPI001E42430C|nr:IS3 family transposase [Mammaliicoccus sciuri]MCD8898091.1 IS3 family transposase [Mammaliicoccus sciuri]MEB7734162.1 IS3 family transposase [Mammaliicoccus sciuri]
MYKKHELDLKLKLINEYKEEKLGYRLISRKYNLDPSLLKTWIYQFDTFGILKQEMFYGEIFDSYDEFEEEIIE